jgi:hypothetical protein
VSDILLNNYDLKVLNGDLVTGDSLEQEADLIINSQPGWWRSFPGLGIDIYNYINEDGNYSGVIWSAIQKQFEYDGKKMKKLETKNNILSIEVENL